MPSSLSSTATPAAPGVPAAMRYAFRTLDRLAPAAGARWAYRLWFTIPRNGKPSRNHAVAGQRFVVRLNGHQVIGQHWGTGTKVVYLVHGWGGRSAQLDGFVQPLVAAGYGVVAFDGPSHGESEPGGWGARRSSFVEQADALTAVIARHGEPHAVVAHSGGCAAVGYALREGMTASRLVFVAPMAHPMDYSYRLAGLLGFGERTRTRLVRRIERKFGVPANHFDLPPLATKLATPPVLLLHDEDDTNTDPAESDAIHRAWPASRLVTTRGLGHYRILRDPAAVNEAVAFVTG